jgi:hypothetical protein
LSVGPARRVALEVAQGVAIERLAVELAKQARSVLAADSVVADGGSLAHRLRRVLLDARRAR